MFDDQNLGNNNQIPNNLPVGEPEDMFAQVEENQPVAENPNIEEVARPTSISTSALDAGILKPKLVSPERNEPVMTVMPRVNESGMEQTNNMPAQDIYSIKEPALGKSLVKLVVVLVALSIIGGGSWWIYNSYIKINPSNLPLDENANFGALETTPTDNTTDPSNLNVIDTVDQDIIEVDITATSDDIAGDIKDDQVLFGEPIDKDADGLDDNREITIGTDPNNWDTDVDELSDGDEVIIWKTNPLNPDTDGDTFLDGMEVKNGYNPAGTGKLFEPPTEKK